MFIRKTQKEDHQVLLDIWERSVRATHHFLSEKDIQALVPVVRDQALSNLELWVLCNEAAEPVGFMGLDNQKLEALFITPSSLRQGGGKLLLQHARKLKGTLQVDVNEQNPESLKFYLANGFTITGRSSTDAQGAPFPLLHLREIDPAQSRGLTTLAP